MLAPNRPAHIYRILATLASVVLTLSLATPAYAMDQAKITLNQQTGGIPTRFTFEATTDADAPISSVTMSFPEGFDLRESQVDVITLAGLTRVPVNGEPTVTGEQLKLELTPEVAPGSVLRIVVRDVVTPAEGGKFALGLKYEADGETRSVKGLSFSYATPPRSEAISRALDRQAWVQAWNNSKGLSIFLKPQLIVTSVPLLFFGWLYSISMVIVAFPLAIVGGLSLAFAKMARLGIVRWVAAAYVNVIRGTPLFLQIAIAFIGLRIAGIRMNDFTTAIIVLALNSSAYLTEIFRAGIQSIHKGQLEAANSLGMTYWQAMRFVVIPQTVKRVLPTMTSEFILLFKDTALFSAFGIIELMYRGNSVVSRTGNLTPFVVAGVYYLLVTIPLINLVGRLEARLALAEGGGAASEVNDSAKRHWWQGPPKDAPVEFTGSSTRHESR